MNVKYEIMNYELEHFQKLLLEYNYWSENINVESPDVVQCSMIQQFC